MAYPDSPTRAHEPTEFYPGWADAFGRELQSRGPVLEINPMTGRVYRTSPEHRARLSASLCAAFAAKRARQAAQR